MRLCPCISYTNEELDAEITEFLQEQGEVLRGNVNHSPKSGKSLHGLNYNLCPIGSPYTSLSKMFHSTTRLSSVHTGFYFYTLHMVTLRPPLLHTQIFPLHYIHTRNSRALPHPDMNNPCMLKVLFDLDNEFYLCLPCLIINRLLCNTLESSKYCSLPSLAPNRGAAGNRIRYCLYSDQDYL